MSLVKLKNFPNRVFAEQAQQILVNEGIPSIINCPDFGIIGAGGSSIPQGADLCVDEEHLERAYDIINTFFDNI
ncbi:MAG: hypothetical protein AB1556_11775 [Bacillota bacterium]